MPVPKAEPRAAAKPPPSAKPPPPPAQPPAYGVGPPAMAGAPQGAPGPPAAPPQTSMPPGTQTGMLPQPRQRGRPAGLPRGRRCDKSSSKPRRRSPGWSGCSGSGSSGRGRGWSHKPWSLGLRLRLGIRLQLGLRDDWRNDRRNASKGHDDWCNLWVHPGPTRPCKAPPPDKWPYTPDMHRICS